MRSADRQLAEDFLVLGKLAGLVLRVDQAAVDFHVEDATSALDEFRIDSGG